MKFVKINYALNQVYHVEDKAIEKMIKSVISSTKGVKLENLKIEINHHSTGYSVDMKAIKNEKKSYYDTTKYIEKEIVYNSKNLMNIIPDNIIISFTEVK